MASYVIIDSKELNQLTFKYVNEADFFKEVCLDVELPKELEERYGLTDYDISVRFHEEGDIDVMVYDDALETSVNIDFSTEVKNEIIELAKKYI